MRQAVPVSATSRNPAEPVGDLLAEFFWVTATGQVAKVLTSAPVQNGVAIYDGPSLEPGLYWAIRLQQVGTPGAVFRSGPL